jgi:hypothetical protein
VAIDRIVRGFAGINGVKVISRGSRQRVVVLEGKYEAASVALVKAWLDTIDALQDTTLGTLSSYGGDKTYTNTMLWRFVPQRRIRPSTGGYSARYRAIFWKLA